MKRNVEPHKQHNLDCETVIRRMSEVIKVLPGVEVSATTARVTEVSPTPYLSLPKLPFWRLLIMYEQKTTTYVSM